MRDAAVLATLALGPVVACGGAPQMPGDCGGSIRFEGTVYVGNTGLKQTAAPGQTLGTGVVVDCDHTTVVDRVAVYAVEGADSRLAIRVGVGKWHGVYVAEQLSRAEWPEVVRRR